MTSEQERMILAELRELRYSLASVKGFILGCEEQGYLTKVRPLFIEEIKNKVNFALEDVVTITEALDRDWWETHGRPKLRLNLTGTWVKKVRATSLGQSWVRNRRRHRARCS